MLPKTGEWAHKGYDVKKGFASFLVTLFLSSSFFLHVNESMTENVECSRQNN